MYIADQTQERFLRRSEAEQRFGAKPQKPAAPEATGYCLFCGEPIAAPPSPQPSPNPPPSPIQGEGVMRGEGVIRRWCNSECRDEWERIDAALRRKGL